MNSQPWTSVDFERWLALQLDSGLTVINPDAVDHIRASLRKGATIEPLCRVIEPNHQTARFLDETDTRDIGLTFDGESSFSDDRH